MSRRRIIMKPFPTDQQVRDILMKKPALVAACFDAFEVKLAEAMHVQTTKLSNIPVGHTFRNPAGHSIYMVRQQAGRHHATEIPVETNGTIYWYAKNKQVVRLPECTADPENRYIACNGMFFNGHYDGTGEPLWSAMRNKAHLYTDAEAGKVAADMGFRVEVETMQHSVSIDTTMHVTEIIAYIRSRGHTVSDWS